MSALSYFNEPAPLAWDVASAIFGASGLEGGLYDPFDLSTLFQTSTGGLPSLPGDPVGLVLDTSGSGHNLSQPTAAARPTLARMPLTGRRNLLTWTEDFSQPAWQRVDITLGAVGEDGLTLITSTGTGARIVGAANVANGATASWSIDLKRGNTDWIFLNLYVQGAGGVIAWFNLATGEKGGSLTQTTGVFIDSDIEEVREGVFRCTVVGSHPSGTTYNVQVSPASGDGSTTRPATGATWYQGRAQLNLGDPIPYQRVTNAFDVTEAGVPDIYDLTFDLTDDALSTTFPATITGDLLIAGTKGSIIEPVNYAAGSTFTLGPDTYTGGTPGIMRAIGNVVGVVLIDRTLTQTERENLLRHYKGKGAKGLLVPGPDVAWPNGTLSVSDFSPQNEGSFLIEDDGENIKITRLVATGSGRVFLDTAPVTIGPNRIQFTITEISTDARGFYAATNGGATGVFANTYPSTPVSFDGVYNLTGGGNGRLRFHFSPCRGADANVGEVGDYMKLSKVISVRELRPQEDW